MSKHHHEDVVGMPVVCWSHGWAFDRPPEMDPAFLRIDIDYSILPFTGYWEIIDA